MEPSPAGVPGPGGCARGGPPVRVRPAVGPGPPAGPDPGLRVHAGPRPGRPPGAPGADGHLRPRGAPAAVPVRGGTVRAGHGRRATPEAGPGPVIRGSGGGLR